MASYIEITNNSEKYINLLKTQNKVLINYNDIKPSAGLTERPNPLWGYYDVKSFTLNNKQIKPNELIENYTILCGDFYCGSGYLIKKHKTSLTVVDN